MSLSGIPHHLLARAAALPSNAHARSLLLEAAGERKVSPTPALHVEGIQGGKEGSGGAGKRRGVPTKLEAKFAREVLDPMVASGELTRYECEALTLRIPKVGAITPDWCGWTADGVPVLLEVKGTRLHEATMLRTKMHAAARPWLRWLVYARKDGSWVIRFDSATHP